MSEKVNKEITDWLDKYGDAEIEKKVERDLLRKERRIKIGIVLVLVGLVVIGHLFGYLLAAMYDNLK